MRWRYLAVRSFPWNYLKIVKIGDLRGPMAVRTIVLLPNQPSANNYCGDLVVDVNDFLFRKLRVDTFVDN